MVDVSVSYEPSEVPENSEQLVTSIREDRRKVADVLEVVSKGHVEKTFVAPEFPYEGMLRLADGTEWDPGAGKGVYVYYSSAWNKLG